MMAALRARRDAFLGRGDAAVTIPAMDGPLRPNRRLDEGRVLRHAAAPDDLAVSGGDVLYSNGDAVFRLSPGAPEDQPVAVFDAAVTCLAADPGGALAAGLDDGRVLLRRGGGQTALQTGGACPTALAFDGDALIVAHGSMAHPPSGWRRDLLERGATGSVWRAPLAGGAPERVADKLAWPAGVLARDGAVVVSESWRHRLLRIAGAETTIVLDDLPGYPGRLSPAIGGAWLCVFAPRTQIVEFVLREPEYRRRMTEEIAEPFWIAPAFASGKSFLEPLQGGAVKHMATLNPWAPTRSYGLVARLDERLEPVASWHSRAGGAFHGVTAAVEHGGSLLVASRGGEAIVAVDPRAADA
jgi:hypothetical protein